MSYDRAKRVSRSRQAAARLTLFPIALAFCHVSRVFRTFGNRPKVSFVAILIVDQDANILHYEAAIEILLQGAVKYGQRRFDDLVTVNVIRRGKADYDVMLADIRDPRPVVFLFEDANDVPPEFRIANEVVLDLRRPDIATCRAAVYMMCGQHISDDDAAFLLTENWRRTAAVFRKGRPAQRSIQMLRKYPIGSLPKVAAAKSKQKEIRLEDLKGYGGAQAWGLQLAADLQAYRNGKLSWEDVDRGLLLSGPPGVGKTRFAAALATSCGIPLIEGSASVWQSAGHLGDMLKAMRATFAAAIAKSPSIVLIDEIDAVGDRLDSGGLNKSYDRKVIAALLECLDGASRREGVVVIGTANYPDHMDAALVRPGRLDRHIEIAFPDGTARLEILEQYLGTKISATAARDFVAATDEWSGAALEQLARSSRRRARLEGRPVCGDDVLASLPEVVALDADRVLTTAVHEAGHVVVGLAVGHRIDRIRLTDRYVRGAKQLHLGGVQFIFEDFPRRTRQTHLDEICVSLAGMIAEEQITGTFDDGVGGSANSDLVRASRLATLVEGVFGMGESLIAEQCENDRELDLLRFKNPTLQARVDALLNEQRQRTTEIVIENLPVIESLSRELANRRSMTGLEVEQFLTAHELRIVRAAEYSCDDDDRQLKRIIVGKRRNHSPLKDRCGSGSPL